MSQTDPAAQWGLPEGFRPVRFPIPASVKDVVRDLLWANEPVVVTISNEGDTISLVATPLRLFSVRSGGVVAGVTGHDVREFPWEGVSNLLLQQAAFNVKIQIHYRSKDGKTVETGRRAKLAKAAVDNLMPFESEAGAQSFEAIFTLWQHAGEKAALDALSDVVE